MKQPFTLDGSADLDALTDAVYEAGACHGSPALLRRIVAQVVAELLAGISEDSGMELMMICRGIRDQT